MKLTYIYHSGYAIEGEQFTFIIDYFKDAENEFVRRSLPSFPGKLYILSSHWHPDHFTRTILEWKKIRPDAEYLFSEDILKKRLASADEATFLVKGDVWQDDKVRIRTFGSTDVGVSFRIEAERKTIFHAGDLNNWHWDEISTPAEIRSAERHFLKELKTLADTTRQVDLAMFPVDCRLGKNYMRGPQQFVDTIRTALFAPMHFDQTYDKANAFRPYAEKTGCHFIAWSHTGESRTI
jgi:L-ascorbate metabolism protein UlaG (beta-lactamase superfamily)